MIFVHSGPGGTHYIRLGYLKALAALGENVVYITVDENYLNHLKTYKPKMIIGSTWDFTEDHIQPLKELNPKMVLRCSEYSSYAESIGNPLVLSTPEERSIVSRLPNVHLHTYYPEEFIEKLTGGWGKVESSLLAANTVDYYEVKQERDRWAFIGGWWPYKSKYLQWIAGLKNGTIYGWGKWPTPFYHGPIDDKDVKKIFSSAKVCPNVMEPFAVEYGFDVNERSYKTMACGALSLIQKNAGAQIIFGDNIDYFETEDELKDKMKYYLDNDKARESMAKRGKRFILENHTYIHRVQKWLTL